MMAPPITRHRTKFKLFFRARADMPVEGKFEIGPFKCKQKMLDSTGKAPTSPKRLQPGDVVITDTSLTPFAFNQPVTPVPAGTEGTVVGVSLDTGAVEIQFRDVPFRQTVFGFLLYKLWFSFACGGDLPRPSRP